MQLNKNSLDLIIDAFMSEMSSEIFVLNKTDEKLSKAFDIIDSHWAKNREKIIDDVIKYLKDVDGVNIED